MRPDVPSLLGARVLPLGPNGGLEAELALDVPSDIGHIEDVVALVCEHVARRYEDAHSIRFNIRVALAEALANAILYGNGSDPGKRVELRARYGPRTVEIYVTDQGPGFNPATVPDPTLPENLERTDGRGVFLIRRLMDEVRYNERGNSVCMILRRS